ncbi:hypothetical protein SESBI_32034 [Sesbania bispinosa]|nr:hypothetical protein SESBI_32034 [Sesbania bispinosa]
MGLIKYGKGHWTKISRHLLWNKTPQNFFKILQATYLYASKRRKPVNYSAGSLMDRNRNLMDASTSYSIQMVLNEPQRTLTLIPKKTPFSQVPPFEEGSRSDNHIDGFQMLTNSATTSMTASANGEIDLELRLG